MAFIDRVKYQGPQSDSVLVWRWPSEELVLGTQVIVGPSQEAILVKGGQAFDTFGPGTHTLATENIPLLRKLVNLPFGGKTPFTAEVYYINRHAKLDMKWGTRDPLRVTDPTYKVIVPVRSFGQMGLRIADARAFLSQVVGTLHHSTSEQIGQYFEGLVITKVKDCIARYIVNERISVMEISAHLSEISEFIGESLTTESSRFGVEVVNFYVMSINVPDDEPSVRKLQEIMAQRAELEQLGDGYRVKRTFDTLDKLAEQPGGAAGSLLSQGLGLGIGLGAGPGIGAQVSSILQTAGAPPGESLQAADPMQRLAKLKSLLDAGLIDPSDFEAKKRQILEEI